MKIKFDFKKRISYFNLNSEEGLLINHERDWKVLVIVSFVFLAIIFAVDAYSLIRVRNSVDVVVDIGSGNQEVYFDEKALNKALNELDKRSQFFEKRKKEVQVVPVSTKATTTNTSL